MIFFLHYRFIIALHMKAFNFSSLIMFDMAFAEQYYLSSPKRLESFFSCSSFAVLVRFNACFMS